MTELSISVDTFHELQRLQRVHKIGHVQPISRTLALELGIVKPTPEEAAEQAAERAKFRQREEETQLGLAAAARSLDAIADPAWRKVLDLHQRAFYGDYSTSYNCYGCDQGCSCDSASWPCKTVRLVAEIHGIPMPGREWDQLNRPKDGSLDAAEVVS